MADIVEELPPPHDSVGAYVLDALPEDERRDFEDHLATCPVCQQAVAELAPVVALLARRYELAQLPGDTDRAAAVPSADLRQRLLAAAQASRSVAPAAPPAPVAPTATVFPFPRRGWMATGWPAAAVLALFATGAVIWALTLQTRLTAREAELATRQTTIAEQAATIAHLEQRVATAFALVPTRDGPHQAEGNLLYADQVHLGLLYVRGLPALPAGQDYQLWYLVDGQPHPGGTFEVNAEGVGSLALTENVVSVEAVALTVEPDGGSAAPTSAILLTGTNETRPG